MFKIRAVLAASLLLCASAPAIAAAPADPARLAAARQTVDYVFPLGTYARIMNGTLDKMMDSVMDSMTRLPLRDLAGISGVDTSKLSSASLAEIMAIYDPRFKERMSISTHAMMTEMSGIMTEFEPEIRDGLAQAYAEKFDSKQLGELNTFFATPTGKEYAADSYMIMMSPQVMAKMQAFMPKLLQQMPAILEKVKAETANLPKPRNYADLTEAEKNKLASLLGIDRAELDKNEAAKARPRD